jgi:hypothetical protein
MNGNQQKLTPVEDGQKTIGLWAASIFAILGLVFMTFWLYNVELVQNGHADSGDIVLLPVTHRSTTRSDKR